MIAATVEIPVVLFAYARSDTLAQALACLRENQVPRLIVFADAAKGPGDAAGVAEVRAMLRAIDWCPVRLVERAENLGLGRNVVSGVSAVAAEYEAFVVWEDDLICVPGTYAWVRAALMHYAPDERVMSACAWTHPRVTPSDRAETPAPYLDARADCWVWGGYARSWRGMEGQSALEKMYQAQQRGLASDAYGADLPAQAVREQAKNIWAVRWLYHHFQHGGLCVRPPWSMVEHIGWGPAATNAGTATEWTNPPLRPAPLVPEVWPAANEHPECRVLWQRANPGGWRRLIRRVRAKLAVG